MYPRDMNPAAIASTQLLHMVLLHDAVAIKTGNVTRMVVIGVKAGLQYCDNGCARPAYRYIAYTPTTCSVGTGHLAGLAEVLVNEYGDDDKVFDVEQVTTFSFTQDLLPRSP